MQKRTRSGERRSTFNHRYTCPSFLSFLIFFLLFQEPLLDDAAFVYCIALQEFRVAKDQEPDTYVKKWGESLTQIRQIYNQMVVRNN